MMAKLLLCLVLISIISPFSYAAIDDELIVRKKYDEWYLVKEDSARNIKAWAKPIKGRKYRIFRIEAVINDAMEKVIAAHLDVANLKKWYANTKEAKILKKISNTEMYYYQIFEAPLMVPDHDVVLRAKLEPYEKNKGFAMISVNSVSDYMAEKEHMGRFKTYEINLKFTPQGGQKTLLEFEGYVDPGSKAPVWLVNAIQLNAPYLSVVNLQKWLGSGQNSNYSKEQF